MSLTKLRNVFVWFVELRLFLALDLLTQPGKSKCLSPARIVRTEERAYVSVAFLNFFRQKVNQIFVVPWTPCISDDRRGGRKC